MYCNKCSAYVEEDAKFCNICGNPLGEDSKWGKRWRRKRAGMAITASVFAVISVIFGISGFACLMAVLCKWLAVVADLTVIMYIFGFPLSIVGFVFGVIAKGFGDNSGVSSTGISFSLITMLVFLLDFLATGAIIGIMHA